jgi:hypothetical protein
MTTQTIDFSSIDKVVFDSTEIKEVIHNVTSIWTYTYAESSIILAEVPVLQESSTAYTPIVIFSADDYPKGTYEMFLSTEERSGQGGVVYDILQNIYVYDIDTNFIAAFGEGSTFESNPDGNNYIVHSAYSSEYSAVTDPILTFETPSAGFKVIAVHVNQHTSCDANSRISYKFRET